VLLLYEDELRSVEGLCAGPRGKGPLREGPCLFACLGSRTFALPNFAHAPRQPPVGRGGWLAGVNPFWKDSLAYDKRSRS
jgi:hypothetical protein